MSEEVSAATVSQEAIHRALRLSYAQAMLGAVYGASTGGMFLIGYALALGAGTVQIGLLSTIPMLCVIVQLPSSAIVESGFSRRRLTLMTSLGHALCWPLIILIPFAASGAASSVQVTALIAIFTLVSLFGQVAGNARSSWVGDLIPAGYRGTFFGRLSMFGGLVGTFFAIFEGAFLDRIKDRGIGVFGLLFGFGMIFGLINAFLFAPQADVPLAKRETRPPFWSMARQALANKPLLLVTLYGTLWSLQSIAGPFYVVYMLDRLKMSYLAIGSVNAVATLVMLAAAPFWGKMVDRYGCRPVIIFCTALASLLPLIWLGLDAPWKVYIFLSAANAIGGFAVAGVSVGLNTLIYKITPSVGRSVQFAIYSIIVVVIAAPMPTLGGLLPVFMQRLGMREDLRYAFYLTVPCLFAALAAARLLIDPGASSTRLLLRNLPLHLTPWRLLNFRTR